MGERSNSNGRSNSKDTGRHPLFNTFVLYVHVTDTHHDKMGVVINQIDKVLKFEKQDLEAPDSIIDEWKCAASYTISHNLEDLPDVVVRLLRQVYWVPEKEINAANEATNRSGRGKFVDKIKTKDDMGQLPASPSSRKSMAPAGGLGDSAGGADAKKKALRKQDSTYAGGDDYWMIGDGQDFSNEKFAARETGPIAENDNKVDKRANRAANVVQEKYRQAMMKERYKRKHGAGAITAGGDKLTRGGDSYRASRMTQAEGGSPKALPKSPARRNTHPDAGSFPVTKIDFNAKRPSMMNVEIAKRMAAHDPSGKGHLMKTRAGGQALQEFLFNGEAAGNFRKNSDKIRMMVGTFSVGDKVLISGLKKATMMPFNGTWGVISRSDMAIDKYTVRCDLDNEERLIGGQFLKSVETVDVEEKKGLTWDDVRQQKRMSVELRQFSGSVMPETRQRKRAFMAESVKLGGTQISKAYGVQRREGSSATSRAIDQMNTGKNGRLGGSIVVGPNEEDPRDTIIYDVDKRGLPSTRNLKMRAINADQFHPGSKTSATSGTPGGSKTPARFSDEETGDEPTFGHERARRRSLNLLSEQPDARPEFGYFATKLNASELSSKLVNTTGGKASRAAGRNRKFRDTRDLKAGLAFESDGEREVFDTQPTIVGGLHKAHQAKEKAHEAHIRAKYNSNQQSEKDFDDLKKILGYRFPDDDFGEDVVAHAVRRYNRKSRNKERQRAEKRAAGRATAEDGSPLDRSKGSARFAGSKAGAVSDTEMPAAKYWADFVLDENYSSADDGSAADITEGRYKLAIEDYSPAETSEDEMEYYYGAKDVTAGASKMEDSQAWGATAARGGSKRVGGGSASAGDADGSFGEGGKPAGIRRSTSGILKKSSSATDLDWKDARAQEVPLIEEIQDTLRQTAKADKDQIKSTPTGRQSLVGQMTDFEMGRTRQTVVKQRSTIGVSKNKNI